MQGNNVADGGFSPQASNLYRLPAELRELPQWCISPGTDADRAPYTIDGRHASSTDPATWTDFETACRVATERGWLIGFVFTAADAFACIDLDVEDDTPQEQLQRYQNIVDTFDSYTEVSRSGRGAHILLRGNIGAGCKRDGVEVYSQERFLICTGNVWLDKPLADRQEPLANMVTQMRPADYDAELPPDMPEKEDDAAVIARAKKAANWEKFAKLARGDWQGDKYPSQSEADMALISIIAFWSPNNEQCKRIFRMSELGKRKKADDRYLNLTLEPIRARQAAEAARQAAARASFKLTGEGLPTNGDAPLPPTMDMGQMFDDLVYLAAEKQMVLFRSNPSIQLTVAGMGALLRHNKTIIPATLEDPEEREAPTFSLWQGSAQRKVAYTMTFDPSAGEFCNSDEGRPAYNLWKPRAHNPPADWQARISPFLKHVTFLVPVVAERERFLDWLAHTEQKPGTLPHSHYLMIATRQGVGRNWLSSLLACVWTGHVALDYDLKGSLGNGFNGQLSRKLLAVVDEINEGGTGERWQHSEKLKSMVTTSERFINVKYGLQHSEKNCCRWLLFSNYETALPLNADDRRWNIIRNPSEPKDEEYYSDLYGTLRDAKLIASVREFLRTRPIAAFNPGARAAMNEAKEAVVAHSMTNEDEKAAELVASHPRDLILAEHLFWAIHDVDPTSMFADTSRRWKLLGPIARKVGIEPLPKSKDRTLFGKRGLKVWILRNPQQWKEASTLAIQQELCRTN